MNNAFVYYILITELFNWTVTAAADWRKSTIDEFEFLNKTKVLLQTH